jgi:hypothetical protein
MGGMCIPSGGSVREDIGCHDFLTRRWEGMGRCHVATPLKKERPPSFLPAALFLNSERNSIQKISHPVPVW